MNRKQAIMSLERVNQKLFYWECKKHISYRMIEKVTMNDMQKIKRYLEEYVKRGNTHSLPIPSGKVADVLKKVGMF
jgi:hypothetical protein